jgi:hypothetical protein
LHFVSNDRRAFGKSDLYPELREEAVGRAVEIAYYHDLAGLLDALATKVPLPVSVDALARSQAVEEAVLSELSRAQVFFEIAATIPVLAQAGGWYSLERPDVVEYQGAHDTTAFVVDDRTWASSTLQWRVERRMAFNRHEPSVFEEWMIDFEFGTTVLVEFDARAQVIQAQVVSRSPLIVATSIRAT